MVQPSSQLLGRGFGHSGSTDEFRGLDARALRFGLVLQDRLAETEGHDAAQRASRRR